MCKKKNLVLTEEIERDPNSYSRWVIASVGEKADRYKRYSRRVGILSVLFSLSVVFILSFQDLSWESITASLLTIGNSLLLAWSQLEKPYERWRLYRKYHRKFEAERSSYINNLDPYNSSNKNQLIFARLRDLQLHLHDEWDGLIPTTEEANKLGKN